MKEYQARKHGLRVVHGLISETVPLEFHLLLNDTPKSNAPQMLVVSRNNFKPSRESEHFTVKKDWQKAIRGPSKRMDISTCLTNVHKVVM